MGAEQGTVAAVSCNDTYAFTKPVRDEIVLVAGVGVAGDVHAGVHVKHRGRVRADPDQPNFRQVHLIQQELFAEVGEKGYAVTAGNLGENVTTTGIDLLALPLGTILRFGPPAPAAESDTILRVGPPAAAAQGDTILGVGPPAAAAESGPMLGGPLAAVLEVAGRARLDVATTASAAAIAAAATRDDPHDPRPAIVLAGLRNPCADQRLPPRPAERGHRAGRRRERRLPGRCHGGGAARRSDPARPRGHRRVAAGPARTA